MTPTRESTLGGAPLATKTSLQALFLATIATGLVACGGGGSTTAPAPAPTPIVIFQPPAPPAPAPATLSASSLLRCVCNTAGTSCAPANANFAPDACTATGEKRWLRSFIDESYLFYRGTQAYVAASPSTREAANFTGSPLAYFNALTTTANAAEDKFSFTLTTAEANATFSGAARGGFGIELSSAYPAYRVVYNEPNSPAQNAGVPRGATLASINGARMVYSADASGRPRMFFPNQAAVDAYVSPPLGSVLTLGYLPPNSANTVTVALTAANVTPSPVLMDRVIDTPSGRVGYIVFNDHISTAQNQMVDAFARLQAAGVSDLVLDLRYNGGGYLFIAAQAAFMIGGSRVANVPIFDRLTYNDKRQADSITYPFLNQYLQLPNIPNQRSGNFSTTLNLPRVYILTQSGTCSASESIINGLKGTRVGTAGVEVIQIGGTTCGKPYGFSQTDNNLTAHFGIEFEGLNNKGEGRFINGIAPNCPVADDLNRPLGDVNERMLATALATRAAGSCQVVASGNEKLQSADFAEVGRSPRNAAATQKIHVKGLQFDR